MKSLTRAQQQLLQHTLLNKRYELERRLRDAEVTPPDIIAAREKVRNYEYRQAERFSEINTQLKAKIAEVELQLTFAADFSTIQQALQALDTWADLLPTP
jgi:hypothetical protein